MIDRFREGISWSVVSDEPLLSQSTRHMCLGQVIVLLASPHASWPLPPVLTHHCPQAFVFLPVNPWCSPNCILHPFLRAQSMSPPLSLIPDEGINVSVIFWFFLFCRRTLFIKSSGVNVSGRVNCLITRLISIWPSLIWALMGLCCLGFVWTCVWACVYGAQWGHLSPV